MVLQYFFLGLLGFSWVQLGFFRFFQVFSGFKILHYFKFFLLRNHYYLPLKIIFIHPAEFAGVWGRSPQWGQGGEAPRHKTISPLINDNNVNNKNDFIYSKCIMVRPLHYIPRQHSIQSGSIISRIYIYNICYFIFIYELNIYL